MKKLLLAILTVGSLISTAQEEKTWRLGVQLGMTANKSKFSGGMSDANARFHQNPYGAAGLDVMVRYDLNKRWKIESGLNLNSLGFEFSLSEDYNFLQKGPRQSQVRTKAGVLEIPLMVSFKFKPNCKNTKWFIGAGISNTFVGKHKQEKTFNPSSDGPSNTTYLSNQTTVKGGVHFSGRLMVGRERVFKRGGILSATLLWNIGFSEIAKAKVEYTVDGKTYQHEFSNKGSFVGLRIGYCFKPLKSTSKISKPKATVAGDASIR